MLNSPSLNANVQYSVSHFYVATMQQRAQRSQKSFFLRIHRRKSRVRFLVIPRFKNRTGTLDVERYFWPPNADERRPRSQ